MSVTKSTGITTIKTLAVTTTATMGGEPLVKKSLLDAANAEIATLKTRLSAVEANTKDLEAKTLRVSTVTNAAAGTRHASKNFCLNFFGLFWFMFFF